MRDENMREANDLLELHECIADAQERFAALLESCLCGRLITIDQYIRYLSFQYHLTRDVQRCFMAIATHPDLARRRTLREFLLHSANEEELHSLVAANDLRRLGMEPLPVPFDVALWRDCFGTVVADRPFVHLGARRSSRTSRMARRRSGSARRWSASS